jgi:exonuclease SbcC
MRIVRLALENFRRHRKTEWEVPDGVTAIVGPNGAGKSTLLEAIAFALYGPRATRTPHAKNLLRSTDAPGADPVRVILDFELAGQAWRIVRELRGKAQNPLASVEIGGTVQVPPAAGSSEQATALVERALGLDRDGFFQTAVAHQGELDRLGRMKPAERRSFVLEMVGIGAVDQAIARARERRNVLRASLEEAGRGLEEGAHVEARLAAARSSHARAADELAAAQAGQEAVAATLTQAHAALERERAVEAARQDAVAQLRWAQSRLAQSDAAAREAEGQLQPSRDARRRMEAALTLAAPHDGLVQQWAVIQAMQEALRMRREGLDRLAGLRRECEALARHVAGLPVVPEPPGTAELERAVEMARGEGIRIAEALAALRERSADAQERMARLERLDAAAMCPTCQQPVTGGHLEHARAALGQAQRQVAAERAEWVERQRRCEAEVRLRQAGLDAARREGLFALEERRRRDAESRLLEEKRRHLEGSEKALPAESGPLPDLAPIKARLDAAKAARDEALQWKGLAARVEELQARLDGLGKARAPLAQAVVEAEARLAALPDNGEGLARAQAERVRLEAQGRAAQHRLLAASLAKRDAERDVQDAQKAFERQQAAQERMAALSRTLAAWTALAGAAGDGLLDRFKDHLIARTAPLIQQEASRLLSLFTQGRYGELLLDEDYEVWILDQGVRYTVERFSGGEQDLVHLALRLAISRLLATRADGGELRFLALDEVFGSLDQGHRERVVGALHQLTGLYSQILVITHNEDLQEMLDHTVRISLVDGEAVPTFQNG